MVKVGPYDLRMNLLEAMRYLVALEQHRHFGRAAQACHITQPALSNALRALEQQYGVTIVRRSRQYEGLTAEGERVVQSARRMLHEHQALTQTLHSEIDRPRGTLRLGVVPTAVPVAARFAARLQARHPGIVPVVLSMSSPEIERGLEALTLDLGLGYLERSAPRARAGARGTRPGTWPVLPQYDERYFLVRRRHGPGAAAEPLRLGPPLTWADAAALPLCLLTEDMHNRSIIDAALTAAGATVRPVIETNSILTLSLSVIAGEVCSVLPGALVGALQTSRQSPLEAQPLTAPEISTPVGFVTAQAERPSRALAAALAMAQEAEWLRHVAAHSGLPE